MVLQTNFPSGLQLSHFVMTKIGLLFLRAIVLSLQGLLRIVVNRENYWGETPGPKGLVEKET